MKSATLRVSEYLAARPAIVECLRLGIINYSALAREIAPGQQLDGVIQALRRYKLRLKRERSVEGRLARILDRVEVVLRTTIVLYPLPRALTDAEVQRLQSARAGGFCHYFQCETRAVVVCHADNEQGVPQSIRSLSEPIRDLVQLTLRHSPEVLKTPGVMARLFGTLAQNDVAVVESVSCAGEQLLYVHSRDLQRVVALLDSYSSRRKAG